MAIIDTLFMTKTSKKPYPLGPHIPIYSPYKGVPPPGVATYGIPLYVKHLGNRSSIESVLRKLLNPQNALENSPKKIRTLIG